MEEANNIKGTFFALSPKYFLLLIVFLLSLFLRTYDISVRPLHSDEGGNFYFVQQVERDGYFSYSHENYHGPSFFYAATAFAKFFGMNDAGLRGAAIFFGAITPLLLLIVRRREGWTYVLLAGLLIALSSSNVFYSRYAIHESILVFATIWFALSLYRWLEDRLAFDLYSASLALTVLVATKETFIICIFWIGVAGLLAGGAKFALSFRDRWDVVKSAFLLFFVTTMISFTGAFQHIQGFKELWMGIIQWLGRSKSDVGHQKPTLYYIEKVVWVTEPYLLIAAGICLLLLVVELARRRVLPWRDDTYRFPVYLSVWSGGTFLTYSLVPYKTPWLVINATAPLLMLIAWWFARLATLPDLKLRLVSWILTAVVVVLSIKYTLEFNFRQIGSYEIASSKPYGKGNPFSYVHTSEGTVLLLGEIFSYFAQKPNAKVLVAVGSVWPFPYYFRDTKQKIDYLKTDDIESYIGKYDIIIADKSVDKELLFFRKKYYRLSDVQESRAYFRQLKEEG